MATSELSTPEPRDSWPELVAEAPPVAAAVAPTITTLTEMAEAAAVAAPRDSWPELVGVSSEEAKKKIQEDKPDADVQVIPADSFVTMDYNTGRVRVFVDPNNKVARAPRIG